MAGWQTRGGQSSCVSRRVLVALVCAVFCPLIFAVPFAQADDVQATGSGMVEAPYVSYNFNNNLNDEAHHSTLSVLPVNASERRGTTSSSFGSDSNGPYWEWHSTYPRGGGFNILVDRNIGQEYTIGLRFSFQHTDGSWRKIIDYKNSVADTGFYFYSGGHLQFYPHPKSPNGIIRNDEVGNIIAQRSHDGMFRAYIVGTDGVPHLVLEINDSNQQAVPYVEGGKSKLGFFFDDLATSAEATPSGKVYDLKIWDKVVDVNDVNNILSGPVTVKYVNDHGKELASSVTLAGARGDKVQPEQKTFPNYVLKEVQPAGEVHFTSGPQTITFIYTWPGLNGDTNNDGTPDVNVDTNNDGEPETDLDVDGDGSADTNIDTNHDGTPDVNLDPNGDGTPDVNIDTNDDGVPDINLDVDNNGDPETNVDVDGDRSADINIDVDNDGIADIMIDVDDDGVPEVNIDTNNDGVPDVNLDTDDTWEWLPSGQGGNADGVWQPDINIDTDNTGTWLPSGSGGNADGVWIADTNIVIPSTTGTPALPIEPEVVELPTGDKVAGGIPATGDNMQRAGLMVISAVLAGGAALALSRKQKVVRADRVNR